MIIDPIFENKHIIYANYKTALLYNTKLVKHVRQKLKQSSLETFKNRDHVKILWRTFALLKALKINLLYSKKALGQAFRNAEVQKSTGNFSHGFDLSLQ